MAAREGAGVITIIAGSRDIFDRDEVFRVLDACPWQITRVLSGGARGIDSLGAEWAQRKSIPVEVFPADWTRHGPKAGPIRNGQMAERAGALVLIWYGDSPGSRDMLRRATQAELVKYVTQWERRG